MLMMLLKTKPTPEGGAAVSVSLEEVEEGDEELQQFYKLLDCDTIDIVTDCINDEWYDLIVDDEGLLTQKPPSYITADGRVLVGSILFCHSDEEGRTTGISEKEALSLITSFPDNMDRLNKYLEQLRDLEERREKWNENR